MIRSIFAKILLGFCLVPASLLLGACSGSEPAPASEPATTGSLSLPLLASAGSHTYRLQGGLYVYGPTFTSLDLNAETSLLTTALQTGSYTANLYSWQLTRDDGAGNFWPVTAVLVSSSSPSFTIFNQATTSLSFQFETDAQLVTVGSGALELTIDVNETAPVCTPLGDDCAVGTWCAPPELTGEPLGCIAEGSVAEGEPCSSPLDCAANSSCYNFGSGAVCRRLCASVDFDEPCSSGGVCTPQGVDYGVCIPETP
jgi:hypothetical protein